MKFGRRVALRVLSAAASLALLPSVARAEPVTVDVGYVPFVAIAQLFVMESEGWAKEAGIELKLTRFNAGPALVQALASGKFDATYMAVSPVVVARAGGIDLKIVATNGIESVSFVGTGALAEAYAKTATPAEAFARFRKETGRPAKIAALPKGTIPDTAIRYYLAANKVADEDVQILGQGEEQVRQAVLAKAADGAAMPEPVITIVLQKDPTAKVLANGKQLMPGHPGFVLSLRESFIKAHPDTARKLVELNARATELIRKDPKRAAKDVLQHMGKGLIEEDVMVAALSSPYNPITDDPNLILSSTETLQDFQLQIGAQAKKVPNAELFDLGFYNSLKAGR
ncbi:ABC transporter substrate-binding protein [Paramagnetospirillum magneticum]|uniref:ABC-type nitrate/sulfonate/bicarbonate transport systems n=1 Tax=Paramagnetospirillum magneticum (strain ATCC 700264 / AMB-1) TaxID=342108 RepID=Q2W658_PARM1|nr:ABC transporter substrate-binding protein [Paramagnetospirillum magneticum]BAE50667.1 ABC-type nitrate/sulfonate/bicarbonate transport systems [Paramagnetospirillum magneticum AMB-1]